MRSIHGAVHATASAAIAGVVVAAALAAHGGASVPCPAGRQYTTTADFLEGTLVNLNTNVGDRLEVNAQASPLPFIWVAASARGTIVKINTESGQILGEYLSAPSGRARNPSRTTVDVNGAVWSGNRDEAAGGLGSVVRVALVEACDCVDRNGNGVIDTSTGLGDIRAWPNTGGADSAGGVSTAEDECITGYFRVAAQNVRHVSVDGSNNVWVGGNLGASNAFALLDGTSGASLATFNVGAGGYGGLVDGSGVLWSASRSPGPMSLLRYDTKNTITTADDTWDIIGVPDAYGVGIDSMGNIWNAQYATNTIRKFDSSGGFLGVFGTGGASNDRGVAVTSDDHVWVANSGGSDVSRLSPTGTVLKVIPLGADGVVPTGVAVDAAGKVWAACLNSNTVKRIDPTAGADGLGAVDLTVNLGAGAGPYNYSDMTGQVLVSVNAIGTWTVVHDGGVEGGPWVSIDWNSDPCADPAEPDGTTIDVEARAADTEAALGAQAYQPVGNGVPLAGAIVGRFIQVRATLQGTANPFQSPVLCELAIRGGCPLAGDLNCDGAVDGGDLAVLLDAWGTRDAAADLDGDGVVNGADLGMLLVNWGPC